MEETKTLDMLDAAEHGDTTRLSALLEESPELVNTSGEYNKTPLHWAAEKNFRDVADLLIQAGADVNARTIWGSTPLEWAGIMGSTAVADLLLEHGASGLSLSIAAGLGRLEEVRSLCEQSASLEGLGIPKRPHDSNDERGWPPDTAHMQGDVLGEAFQLACRNGHLEVARYLLDRGADVNAKGYFGGTGLHWAALNGHREMVVYLLDQEVDLTIRDHGFKSTAAGWASEGGHDDIYAIIKNREGGLEIER